MSSREEFVTLLTKQKIVKGDVVFILQGDGLNRAPFAAQLFKDKVSPLVAIVGNDTRREYGSYSSSEVREELLKHGVPSEAVYLEEVAPHTKAEAARAMELVKEKGWKTMLIVTSPHHQYRAFLTFLKAMHDVKLDIALVNAPADLSLIEETPWGKRADLLEQEFAKIAEYQKKGDVASYEDGIRYLEESA